MTDKLNNSYRLKTLYIILFCFTLCDIIAQRGDGYTFDTTKIKRGSFIKKDYKLFQKNSCDTKKYVDNKVAQELFCRAQYYFSINNFVNSIQLLQQAYIKSSSKAFKFQIIKLVAVSYRQLGDTSKANLYDAKVYKILHINPELDK